MSARDRAMLNTERGKLRAVIMISRASALNDKLKALLSQLHWQFSDHVQEPLRTLTSVSIGERTKSVANSLRTLRNISQSLVAISGRPNAIGSSELSKLRDHHETYLQNSDQ